jgi:hypothetical protein
VLRNEKVEGKHLSNKWLSINGDAAYKKIINCTSVSDLKSGRNTRWNSAGIQNIWFLRLAVTGRCIRFLDTTVTNFRNGKVSLIFLGLSLHEKHLLYSWFFIDTFVFWTFRAQFSKSNYTFLGIESQRRIFLYWPFVYEAPLNKYIGHPWPCFSKLTKIYHFPGQSLQKEQFFLYLPFLLRHAIEENRSVL